jgi:hypothetical protein
MRSSIGPVLANLWVVRQIIDDLRISFRSIKAKPGFALLVVLILALGIGANIALLAVVNGLVLRPLPYGAVNELVEISQIRQGLPIADLNRAGSFEGVTAFTARNFEVSRDDGTKFLFGFRASANLFEVLGVHALIGRTFISGEQAQPIVMLSYEYWRQISGDPNVVGQTLTVDGEKRTIIGILPPDFTLQVRDGNLFIPFPVDDGRVIGRLRHGV